MLEVRSAADQRAGSLRADCASCVGLCCVALAFAKSQDFPFDKETGEPCRNLQQDYTCGIHPQLRERGFKGCTVFDCAGAGQKVTQVAFGGSGWREDPASREFMFATFQVMRPMHELLWYLHDALSRSEAVELHDELERLYLEIDLRTRQDADGVMATDVGAFQGRVKVVLARVSDLVLAEPARRRAPSTAATRAVPGANLVGAKLAQVDLQGADLRGAKLIRADLRDANLVAANLIGADMRDADLSGADLSGALFLTQLQMSSADGDARTRISASLSRPVHWD